MRRSALILVACGIGLGGLAVDQLVKLASVAFLTPGVPVPIVGDLLQLQLIRNPGAAFGMGSSATIVFTILAMVATLACLFVVLPRVNRIWQAVVAGLFLAGITGNLVDRIFQPPAALHGHVIDMFSLRGFAIFNVADICITVAAGIVIGWSLFADRAEAKARKAAAS